MLTLVAALSTTATPRIAGFGGSGFIGSHVCKELVSRGCTVTSISRSGLDTRGAIRIDGSDPTVPERFPGEAWVDQVTWIAADTADEDQLTEALASGVDGVVGCIGGPPLLRMSQNSWNGYKWSDESHETYSKSLAPNALAFAAARRAGARRCAFVGVAQMAEMAYGGTLPGVYKAKRDAAAAARAAFGEELVEFGPHLVVPAGDPRLAALDSGWARGLIGLNKAIGGLGYRGEDFATRTSLTPPVCVMDLALAAAAAVTGDVDVDASERVVMACDDGDVDAREVRTLGRHVDGTEAIGRLARQAEMSGRARA